MKISTMDSEHFDYALDSKVWGQEPEVTPDGRVAKTVFTLEDIQKASEMGRTAGALEMREIARKTCIALRDTQRFLFGEPTIAANYKAGTIVGLDLAEQAIANLPIPGEGK